MQNQTVAHFYNSPNLDVQVLFCEYHTIMTITTLRLAHGHAFTKAWLSELHE